MAYLEFMMVVLKETPKFEVTKVANKVLSFASKESVLAVISCLLICRDRNLNQTINAIYSTDSFIMQLVHSEASKVAPDLANQINNAVILK